MTFRPLLATALVALGATACASAIGAPVRPMIEVIGDEPLALSEAPDAIVVASDGAVWVASGPLQAFVRESPGTDRFHEFPYTNGGAAVMSAAAGDGGAVWFLDGLNTEAVWRVDPDGAYSHVTLQGQARRNAAGLGAGDRSGRAAAILGDTLVRFGDDGSQQIWPIPGGYAPGGPIATGADGTTWFTTYDGDAGVGWLAPDGLFDFAPSTNASYLIACANTGAAYLSWNRESGAHVDDYSIGWVTEAGVQTHVRRWPAPTPTPAPVATRFRYPLAVTCGLCGAPMTPSPRPSRALLACTSNTAWVQIDERLDRLEADGTIRSFDLASVLAGSVATADAPASNAAQTVWLYSVKSQRLIGLVVR